MDLALCAFAEIVALAREGEKHLFLQFYSVQRVQRNCQNCPKSNCSWALQRQRTGFGFFYKTGSLLAGTSSSGHAYVFGKHRYRPRRQIPGLAAQKSDDSVQCHFFPFQGRISPSPSALRYTSSSHLPWNRCTTAILQLHRELLSSYDPTLKVRAVCCSKNAFLRQRKMLLLCHPPFNRGPAPIFARGLYRFPSAPPPATKNHRQNLGRWWRRPRPHCLRKCVSGVVLAASPHSIPYLLVFAMGQRPKSR